MTIPILILTIILLLGLVGGGAIWFILRKRQIAQQSTRETLPFRWKYIILPVAIFLLSIALTAAFYHRLPAEVAYNFTLSGSPDKWLSREMAVVWTLVPQFLLMSMAAAITWGVTKLGIASKPTEGTGIKSERVISMMGNMVALPQIVLCFALIDIFSYNSYQTHIMPLWVFTLIIMVLGVVVLSIFFISAIRQAQ